jgi:hypothetical protein
MKPLSKGCLIFSLQHERERHKSTYAAKVLWMYDVSIDER